MKLGILGGTFDPIHNAHLFIAEEARIRFNLDSLIFVPNAVPPHKDWVVVAESLDRLRMTELATSGNPGFVCSSIEFVRPGPSYTVDTLRAIHQSNPDAEIFFISGADTVAEIETWYRPKEILSLATIIAAERPGYLWDSNRVSLPSWLSDRVVPLATTHLDISSTEIRRRVHDNLPIRYLTPDPVVEYIAERGLYR